MHIPGTRIPDCRPSRRKLFVYYLEKEENFMTSNKGKRLNQYTNDYIVFDLETTGLRPDSDEIIEISAIKVRNHQVEEQFSTLVNPKRHIPKDATAVNGITDDMVKDAPSLKEAMESFYDFIGNDILVGHNIHTFDMAFIYNAAQRVLNAGINNDYIDTLYMARKCLPQLSHHRLSDVSEHFRISTEGAHRALCDCIMNQKCYEELGKIWKEKNITPSDILCPQCGAEMIRRKGKFGEFYGCSNFPRCRGTRKC